MLSGLSGSYLDMSQGEPVASRRQRAIDIVLWVFALFLAWVFIRQGYAKFSDSSGWARAFRTWHFPAWFRVLIGIGETTAAVLLLMPRTATAGALVIIVVMLGAMATHAYWGHPSQMTSEILPLFLATMVAIGRRKAFALRRRAALAS
jgi:putative oxidoreductase